MADISGELAAIRTAVYGEQIRASIISALEKMNSQIAGIEVAAYTSAYTFKGAVPDSSQLPSARNREGDLYYVTADGLNYAWNGSIWYSVGGMVHTGEANSGAEEIDDGTDLGDEVSGAVEE